MNSWAYIAGGLCLLLLLCLLWKEISRTNAARRSWRVLSVVLAVAALYCLAVPPGYNSSQQLTNGNEAILLTEGSNPDSLSKFLNSNPAGIPVFTLDEKIAADARYHASLVMDPADLLEKKYRALHVFRLWC